jgi:hypothetical protein
MWVGPKFKRLCAPLPPPPLLPPLPPPPRASQVEYLEYLSSVTILYGNAQQQLFCSKVLRWKGGG